MSGLTELDAGELAWRVGRGVRSALGVHGFAQGGFLVEAGKRAVDELSPLVARLAFPETWRVVVAVPPGPKGIHGGDEIRLFAELRDRPAPLAQTEAMCRLVLLGMLPALRENDLEAFGEALHDYNRRAGELFAPVQGGPYAGTAVAELVRFFRDQGARGVGQSSWGPAVFAVTGDEARAADLTLRARQRFGLEPGAVWITRAWNRSCA